MAGWPKWAANIVRAVVGNSSGPFDASNPMPVQEVGSPGGSTTVVQPNPDLLKADANLQIADADVGNANPVPVSDAGGSLTVDSPQLPAALVGGRLATDGSAVTQPVSSATLASAAKQPALGTAGAASADVISVQGIAGGVAQLVSAASLPLPAGAATETTLATLLQEGVVPTGYTPDAGGTHALGWLGTIRKVLTDIKALLPAALGAGGGLKVDGSGTALPVSGTVTATGGKTSNAAAPGATNVGTLPAIANAAAPTLTEGYQVAESVDLSGNQRVTLGTYINGEDPSNNAMMVRQRDGWSIYHEPAANTQATITRAAVGAVYHVCTGITATFAATGIATAASVYVRLRDGASGGGTILWTGAIAVTAVAGDSKAIALSGLWLKGSVNSAMTLEFSVAGGANTVETVTLTGQDVSS